MPQGLVKPLDERPSCPVSWRSIAIVPFLLRGKKSSRKGLQTTVPICSFHRCFHTLRNWLEPLLEERQNDRILKKVYHILSNSHLHTLSYRRLLLLYGYDEYSLLKLRWKKQSSTVVLFLKIVKNWRWENKLLLIPLQHRLFLSKEKINGELRFKIFHRLWIKVNAPVSGRLRTFLFFISVK